MWRWKDFKPEELDCPCCGEQHLDEKFMDSLQALRDAWGKSIVINSGHRCPKHNKAVGGASKSQHLKIAADCRISGDEQDTFIKLAKANGFTGIGRYNTFVHIDQGKPRSWTG